MLDDEGKATFKEGVETIEGVMEEDMEQILEIIIPEGVKKISKFAFGCDKEQKGGCINLVKVTVPATLEEVGEFAFAK